MNNPMQPFSGEIRPGIKALVIKGPSTGKVVDVIEDLGDHVKGDDFIYDDCEWQVVQTGHHFAIQGDLTVDMTGCDRTTRVSRAPFHADGLMPLPPLNEEQTQQTEKKVAA